MLLAKWTAFHVGIILVITLPNIQCCHIKEMDIPVIVRNGTGPVDLVCAYEINENENGLVVKWYHNSYLIYQWIPPMLPRDVGIVKGLTEYPEENLKNPYSYSKIRLKTVTLDMTGEYVCTVSTFQEEATETAKMTVYVPENNLTVYATEFNRTHVNVTCLVTGAHPVPVLTFYVEGIVARKGSDVVLLAEQYRENPWLMRQMIIEESTDPALIECEMSFPDTNYRRRERIVYYPTEFLQQTSGVKTIIGRTLYVNVFFIGVVYMILNV